MMKTVNSPDEKENHYESYILTSDVFFDFDKDVFLPNAPAMLDKFISILKEKFSRIDRINVTDHVDCLGDKEHNQRISTTRADLVGAYFINKGLPVLSIYSYGAGNRFPMVTSRENISRSQRIYSLQANRRIEIEVVGERRMQRKSFTEFFTKFVAWLLSASSKRR